jgi:uncharacterized membrane protein
MALASVVLTPAINVRSLLHCFALGAAVFARRCFARANWVRALLSFRIFHFLYSPGSGSRTGDPWLDINHPEQILLFRKGHNAAAHSPSALYSSRLLFNTEQPIRSRAVMFSFGTDVHRLRTMAIKRGDYEMTIQNSVVAVYPTHTEADQAVKELQRGGVDMQKLSIVGRGYHTDEHAMGYYNTGDRMKYWGKVGAFWGGFWGLLFGSAFFMIPGLGPILAAGPVVAWIVAGLEGAVEVGTLGALGAGLFSIGIPKDSIVKYEAAIKTDQFVLIAHGTAAEVEKAKSIIETTHPAHLTVHSGEAKAAAV